MMAGGASIRGHVALADVSVSYGGRTVVDRISLDIAPGEFVCLLGPSGCGKTTTLRAIAGLVSIDAGTISIDERPVNHLPAHQREIAMVFQDLALFPHMTVYENVAFGLQLRRQPATAIRENVGAMLRLLHLDEFGGRLPRQLSGGQQQRVAIARSLVVKPSVLLLDEPFAALDRKLREEMRQEIRLLQRRLGITVVLVTHDQEEALTMSDRLVVMDRGVLEQVGTPSEVYEAPQSRFVVNFVGYSNFLKVEDAVLRGDEIHCRVAGIDVASSSYPLPSDTPGQVELAIRPERIRIAGAGGAVLPNCLPGTVSDMTYEGMSITYEVTLSDGQTLLVREQNPGSAAARRRYRPQDRVVLEWGREDAMLIGGPELA